MAGCFNPSGDVYKVMQPMVHFILSLGMGFAMEVKHRRKYLAILSLGFVGLLPDIDHLFRINGVSGVLHNTTALGSLPLAAFIAVYLLEERYRPLSSSAQRFMVSVTVVLLGHLILDLIAGNTIDLGPFSGGGTFSVSPVPIIELSNYGAVITSTDMLWLLILGMVVCGNLVQRALYESVENFESNHGLGTRTLTYQDKVNAIISKPMRLEMPAN